MPQKKKEWEGPKWVLHNVHTVFKTRAHCSACLWSHFLPVRGWDAFDKVRLLRSRGGCLCSHTCRDKHWYSNMHSPLVDDCLPLYVLITVTHHSSIPLFSLYTSDPPLLGVFTSLKIHRKNFLFSSCCVAGKLGSQTRHLLVGAEAISAPRLPGAPVAISSSALIHSPSHPTQRKERWWKNSAAKSCYSPLLPKKINSKKNRSAHSCHRVTEGCVHYYYLCHYTTHVWG